MRQTWFKPFGWVYYPTSWQGVVIALLLVLFCGHIFLFVDSTSHSASDTLYGIFPYWALAMGVYLWIATRKSPRKR